VYSIVVARALGRLSSLLCIYLSFLFYELEPSSKFSPTGWFWVLVLVLMGSLSTSCRPRAVCLRPPASVVFLSYITLCHTLESSQALLLALRRNFLLTKKMWWPLGFQNKYFLGERLHGGDIQLTSSSQCLCLPILHSTFKWQFSYLPTIMDTANLKHAILDQILYP